MLQVKESKQICADILTNKQEIDDMEQLICNAATEIQDNESELYNYFEQLVSKANSSMIAEKNRIALMIKHIDSIVEARSKKNIEVPSQKKLSKLYNNFMSSELPTVYSPYTPLCGAYPLPPDQAIPLESFVCIAHEDMYILACVIGFDPETSEYTVVDADPENTDIQPIVVPNDKIIALPTCYPHRRAKANTHPNHSKVLALWQDDGVWTSVFYPAVVNIAPTYAPCMYHLKFEGEETVYYLEVPERFIVAYPPGCQ